MKVGYDAYLRGNVRGVAVQRCGLNLNIFLKVFPLSFIPLGLPTFVIVVCNVRLKMYSRALSPFSVFPWNQGIHSYGLPLLQLRMGGVRLGKGVVR